MEHGVDVRRKNARHIVVKSAARDVGNAVEREINIHRGFDRRPIAGVRLQKSFADRLMIQLGKFGVDFVAAAVEEHLTRKAEAVRVQAVRGKTDRDVSRFDLLAGNQFVLLDNTVDDADQVEVVAVHARHFSGFAAEHRAVHLFAGVRNAAEDILIKRAAEFADADVVQEEHRFRTLNADVVHAMVDNVVTDRVELLHEGGDHEFGSNAVDAGDEHRLFVFRQINLKESAETADGGEHFGAFRRREFLFDAREQFRGEIDVNAGFFVSRDFFVFRSHFYLFRWLFQFFPSIIYTHFRKIKAEIHENYAANWIFSVLTLYLKGKGSEQRF